MKPNPMAIGQAGNILAAALCAAGALLSAIVAFTELAPFQGTQTDRDLFTRLSTSPVGIGVSPYAQRAALDDCFVAMTSIFGKAQPAEARGQLLQNCRDAGLRITALSPSFSYAWLVLAIISAEQDDATAFVDALLRSYTTGRNELWLAERRLLLAQSNRERLPDLFLPMMRNDIALHLMNEDGTKRLAWLMIKDKDLFEKVVEVGDTMSDDEKWRLLRAIESARKAANTELNS